LSFHVSSIHKIYFFLVTRFLYKMTGYGLNTSIVPRLAFGPTDPPIQWVPAALHRGVKRSKLEVHH